MALAEAVKEWGGNVRHFEYTAENAAGGDLLRTMEAIFSRLDAVKEIDLQFKEEREERKTLLLELGRVNAKLDAANAKLDAEKEAREEERKAAKARIAELEAALAAEGKATREAVTAEGKEIAGKLDAVLLRHEVERLEDAGRLLGEWKKSGLTEKQFQVARWTVAGKRQDEIAVLVGASQGEVSKQWREACRKRPELRKLKGKAMHPTKGGEDRSRA